MHLPPHFVPRLGCDFRDLAIGHVGKACEHFTKISERVKTATAAVFNDGINDGAALTGIGITDEEPVLFSDGRGTNGVFYEVVVQLHAAIIQINFQCGPLAQSVINGSAQQALRQLSSAALEPDQRALDAFDNGTALMSACNGAQLWTGTLFAQVRFDPVEVLDLAHEPAAHAGRLFE